MGALSPSRSSLRICMPYLGMMKLAMPNSSIVTPDWSQALFSMDHETRGVERGLCLSFGEGDGGGAGPRGFSLAPPLELAGTRSSSRRSSRSSSPSNKEERSLRGASLAGGLAEAAAAVAGRALAGFAGEDGAAGADFGTGLAAPAVLTAGRGGTRSVWPHLQRTAPPVGLAATSKTVLQAGHLTFMFYPASCLGARRIPASVTAAKWLARRTTALRSDDFASPVLVGSHAHRGKGTGQFLL